VAEAVDALQDHRVDAPAPVAVAVARGDDQTLELADVTADPAVRQALLTFVGIGGGYAGVEGLGQLIDFIEKALPFYPTITRSDVKFILATHGKRLLDNIDLSLTPL